MAGEGRGRCHAVAVACTFALLARSTGHVWDGSGTQSTSVRPHFDRSLRPILRLRRGRQCVTQQNTQAYRQVPIVHPYPGYLLDPQIQTKMAPFDALAGVPRAVLVSPSKPPYGRLRCCSRTGTHSVLVVQVRGASVRVPHFGRVHRGRGQRLRPQCRVDKRAFLEYRLIRGAHPSPILQSVCILCNATAPH